MGFVSELKRRNVFRMAILYAIAAWLIMQVAEVVIGLVGLPDWIGPAVLGVIAVAFPVALIFAWFFEITPSGISLEKDIDPQESITHITGRRLDLIVIALLTAAVFLFAIDKWWTSKPTENSIAVLPFVDMSAGSDNEFFSDGISEELLNLLAQIPELRVAARTSAFSYKGKDATAATIGKELNVTHILEGSVRKSGKDIRITAQLIDTRSDSHLWSQTFDRKLDDIFAIQDDIAAEVVEQLKIKLLSDLPQIQKVDPQAYSLLLQARHLSRQGTSTAFDEAIDLYEKSLTIDPNLAAAWDGLSGIYANQAGFGLRSAEKSYADAREAAERALAIDPNYAPAYAGLGWIAMMYDRDLETAARHFERATNLAPSNTDILANAAVLAILLGRMETAIDVNLYVISRDPLSTSHFNLAVAYLWAGRFDDVLATLEMLLTLRPEHVLANYYIGVAMLLKGRPDAAIDAMHKEPADLWRLIGLAMAYHAAGELDASDAALSELITTAGQSAPYNIAHVLAFRGEVDRAFEWLEKAYQLDDPGLVEIIGEPLFQNLRKDSRWPVFMEKIDRSPAMLADIRFVIDLQN
jgi:TolB-like protein/Tfp pilus assembly protein PilF